MTERNQEFWKDKAYKDNKSKQIAKRMKANGYTLDQIFKARADLFYVNNTVGMTPTMLRGFKKLEKSLEGKYEDSDTTTSTKKEKNTDKRLILEGELVHIRDTLLLCIKNRATNMDALTKSLEIVNIALVNTQTKNTPKQSEISDTPTLDTPKSEIVDNTKRNWEKSTDMEFKGW